MGVGQPKDPRVPELGVFCLELFEFGFCALNICSELFGFDVGSFGCYNSFMHHSGAQTLAALEWTICWIPSALDLLFAVCVCLVGWCPVVLPKLLK